MFLSNFKYVESLYIFNMNHLLLNLFLALISKQIVLQFYAINSFDGITLPKYGNNNFKISFWQSLLYMCELLCKIYNYNFA